MRPVPVHRQPRDHLRLHPGGYCASAAILGACATVLLAPSAGLAQALPANPPPAAVGSPSLLPFVSAANVATLCVIAYGGACLVFQTVLLWRVKAHAMDVLRNLAVTTVVTLAILALTLGIDQTALSPVTGLFGTIVGFLLGQQTRLGASAPEEIRPANVQPGTLPPPRPEAPV